MPLRMASRWAARWTRWLTLPGANISHSVVKLNWLTVKIDIAPLIKPTGRDLLVSSDGPRRPSGSYPLARSFPVPSLPREKTSARIRPSPLRKPRHRMIGRPAESPGNADPANTTTIRMPTMEGVPTVAAWREKYRLLRVIMSLLFQGAPPLGAGNGVQCHCRSQMLAARFAASVARDAIVLSPRCHGA